MDRTGGVSPRHLVLGMAALTFVFVAYSLFTGDAKTTPNYKKVTFVDNTNRNIKPGNGLGDRARNKTLKTGRPNFLFILLDEMGWTDAGYLGSKFYETPNIDRLAASGISFTNAYANSHVCAPSRASILSGQYGPRHNVYTIGTETAPHAGRASDRKLMPAKSNRYLPLETVTIAEALKSGGYKTASIGKWHLGAAKDGRDAKQQGFDIDLGGRDTGSTDSHWWPYGLPGLDQDGKKGEYLTDRMTSEAMNFMEQNQNDPWFIYLSFYAVHTPIQAPNPLTDKYRHKAKADSRHTHAEYAGMIESVDQNLFRLMEKLDDLNLAEDTLVVFFSDNGGLIGITSNAPLRGGKGVLYEGGVKEPLIIRWKGKIQPGQVSDVPVIGTDFYPTFLELAGLQPPEGHVLDGKSLAPLLFSEDAQSELEKRPLFWHFPNYMVGHYMGFSDTWAQTPSGSVRAGDWKLIEFFEDNSTELYNLREDISEKQNLAEKFPEKVKELRQLMIDWRKETNAPVPTQPNPEWDRQNRKKSI